MLANLRELPKYECDLDSSGPFLATWRWITDMQLPKSFGPNGAYRPVAMLGRGAIATVYRARHEALGRDVAIKVVRSDVVLGDDALRRFQRSAREGARLSGHPNIVTVYDYGEEDGQVYLVLQYVEGDTLEQRLDRPISSVEIATVIQQISSALDFAHSYNLVHRDLKPSNILLGNDGRAVLSDFGIDAILDATHTMTESSIGTPEYMAPEQVTGSPIDARTDIYALGITAYRMLAGRTPFQGPLMSVLHQQVYARPPDIADIVPSIPNGVNDVVQRALAKDPSARYQSAGEFAAGLAAALQTPFAIYGQSSAAVDRAHSARSGQRAVLDEQRGAPQAEDVPSSRPLRIFLCHASDDKPAVRHLYQRLLADRFDPWLDEEKLLPGQDWEREIERAVRASDVVVVCLSRRSCTKTGFVQKEIRQALDVADEQPEDAIFLIPLRLDECDVPQRLSRWHWVNWFEGGGYDRLLRALQVRASSIEATGVSA